MTLPKSPIIKAFMSEIKGFQISKDAKEDLVDSVENWLIQLGISTKNRIKEKIKTGEQKSNLKTITETDILDIFDIPKNSKPVIKFEPVMVGGIEIWRKTIEERLKRLEEQHEEDAWKESLERKKPELEVE